MCATYEDIVPDHDVSVLRPTKLQELKFTFRTLWPFVEMILILHSKTWMRYDIPIYK